MNKLLIIVLTGAALIGVALQAEAQPGRGAGASGNSGTPAPSSMGNRRGDFGRMQREHEQESTRGAFHREQAGDTAAEMRARRERRNEIMDAYREDRNPGQEGRSEPQERESRPAKKPWWKFWD